MCSILGYLSKHSFSAEFSGTALNMTGRESKGCPTSRCTWFETKVTLGGEHP